MVPTHRTGIATARFVDHVGMTVPDMGTAIRFFEHALGARLLWRAGPFNETPTGVAMESVEIAMLRLGTSINLELLAYRAEKQQREMPSNIDIGAGHIAVFVDDLNAAAASLRSMAPNFWQGPWKGPGKRRRVNTLVLQNSLGRIHGNPQKTTAPALRKGYQLPALPSERVVA